MIQRVGSGSLLLRVKREAAQDYKIKIYGQELNRTTYNLARMNMILHDVHYADFDIRQENTLEHPQHRDLRLMLLLPIRRFLHIGVRIRCL